MLSQILAVMASFVACTFAEPTPKAEAPDPIVGNWVWIHDDLVTINADGTASSTQGLRATWKFLDNKQVERKYEFIWNGGVLRISLPLPTMERRFV